MAMIKRLIVKAQLKKAEPIDIVPHFANEADEAKWWFNNQDRVEASFKAKYNVDKEN